MPMKLLKYMLKETESNVNDTIVMFQWRVRKQKYGVGLFGEIFLMCQWKKGDNGQAVTIFCSPEHRINDSKPSLCHHLPEKCFSFSNRALVCSTFVLSHRSAGKKSSKTTKQNMEKTDGPSSPPQHGGKGVTLPLNPAQHRSQQCWARVGSKECTSAPPVQPPTEPNRQKWSKNA